MKIIVLGVSDIELFQPVTFEVDCIDKDESSEIVQSTCWYNLGNFLVGLLGNPVVNDRCCSIAVMSNIITITFIMPKLIGGYKCKVMAHYYKNLENHGRGMVTIPSSTGIINVHSDN